MKLPYLIIIDDDIQVLRAIQRDIRNKYRDEYKVAATESANEALELIKELKLKNEEVALFISDQRMPEMEGIGAILQIKRRPRPPKIIAISGAGPGGRRDYLSWAKHLGADEVLAKPFRMSQILALASRLISSNSNYLAGQGN